MPLENRNLKTGTVLSARYKGKERTCEVVHTEDGLRYRLDDGTEHKSTSSAGKAAMGGVSCNGWRFWSIAGTEASTKAKKASAAKKPAKATVAAKKGAKAKATTKTGAKAKAAKPKTGKAARSAAKSDDSYGCGVCGETFSTMKAATQHATEAHVS